MVARRGDYPVVPPHVAEVHIQGMSPAVGFLLLPLFVCPHLPLLTRVQHVSLPIVAVGHQQRPHLGPRVLSVMQGPADADMSFGVLFCTVWVNYFHHEALVEMAIRGPPRDGGAHVETLPLAQAVLNQPGVQESRDGFLKGTGRFKDLVNVNTVKSLAAVAHDLLSENPQLRWRHQLLARDGGQVEEETLSRLSARTGQVLRGFWKKTNRNIYGKLWLFESMPGPCTLSNFLFTLIDRMCLLLTSYWTHWFKTLEKW